MKLEEMEEKLDAVCLESKEAKEQILAKLSNIEVAVDALYEEKYHKEHAKVLALEGRLHEMELNEKKMEGINKLQRESGEKQARSRSRTKPRGRRKQSMFS